MVAVPDADLLREMIGFAAQSMKNRAPSGSHLPSLGCYHRLLRHRPHQRNFVKRALLGHSQRC
jgi:hypothetical protein